MTAKPWPHPEDSREDRAKRVAASYRELLQRIAAGQPDAYGLPIDPAGELHRLDHHWITHGATWIKPHRNPYDDNDWITANDAAHYADVDPKTIRKWAERGHIRADHDHDGTPLYNVGDLNTHEANKIRTRLQRAKGRT